MVATGALETTATTDATTVAQNVTTAGITEESGTESDGDSEMSYDDDEESCCSDSTDSSDIADYWEREGLLHHRRESSYLPGVTRQFSRYREKVIYDWCEPAELKQFVKSRRLQDPFPHGVTLKYYYIRILEQADRELRFPFMKLPTEMQLLIYRGLLSVPKPSDQQECLYWKLHPAILRVSKQIYQEAKGVLYDENIFTADFTVSAGNTYSLIKIGRVHKTLEYARCGHAKYFRMPQGIEDYPEFFRRISRLEVSLKYTIDGTEKVLGDGAISLSPYVYTLASFLMDGHKLKHLTIRLDISSEIEEHQYGSVLYTLRRLRNIPHVTIIGHIPAHVKRKLICDLTSTEPAFNTMKHWKLLVDEAKAQLSILEAMHEDVECMCGECPMPDCIEELHFKLFSLEEAKQESCFNSRLEENFIARLAMLRTVLQRVQVNELQSMVTNLINKRNALKEYEAVTDEGRLDEAAKIWAGKLFDEEKRYESDDDWSDDDPKSAAEDVRMRGGLPESAEGSPEL